MGWPEDNANGIWYDPAEGSPTPLVRWKWIIGLPGYLILCLCWYHNSSTELCRFKNISKFLEYPPEVGVFHIADIWWRPVRFWNGSGAHAGGPGWPSLGTRPHGGSGREAAWTLTMSSGSANLHCNWYSMHSWKLPTLQQNSLYETSSWENLLLVSIYKIWWSNTEMSEKGLCLDRIVLSNWEWQSWQQHRGWKQVRDGQWRRRIVV